MRELGEPQLTFNYARAFSDFLTNFTFGQGVSFRSPKETEAIVPTLLQRVWEKDNHKASLLWEIGQTGSVAGDVFVKVAYEDPYVDPAGQLHEGRVRILPLNPSFCFPEWHPHDRSRMIRFKLKYRFWGTALEGTRQVFTYVELITDDAIEEYINDELIDSRPNPLGEIPIVSIPNIPVPSSPWGLSDIGDIIGLNREYNEKATDISDIINYHASPVTVIIGAKANNLEKGPRKVWGGLPKDAKVENLELSDNLDGPLKYLEVLKQSMHEMTGVPVSALGQGMPVSNTSGVALSIMYQPLVNRFTLKKTQYGWGFEKINRLIMKTLALKDPESFLYNPTVDVPLQEGQLDRLDPTDPITYQSIAHFQPPLPVDKLIKLNEIQAKMLLGLESRRGALRDLGEEFPDEKLQELFDEQVQDIKEQGVKTLIQASIAAAISMATGLPVGPDGSMGPPAPGPGADGANGAASGGNASQNKPTNDSKPQPGASLPGMPFPESLDPNEILNEITTLAAGTKIPQRRNPNSDD
jgi:hypothetical protein